MLNEVFKKFEEDTQALVEKYKKNREAVPEETLKTKYKASYEALRGEIAERMNLITVHILCNGILVPKEVAKSYGEKISALANAAGLPKLIGEAIFKRYSYFEAVNLALQFRVAVINPIYCYD